jgi:uncharacterized protein
MKRSLRWARVWVALLGLTASVHAFECPPLEIAVAKHASPRYAESLLWEIAGATGQTSFVFGTMHLAAAKTGQPTAAVTAALMDSKQFGMEVVLDVDALLQISEQMHFSDATTLSSIIGPALFARVRTLMQRYGVDGKATDQLKPWAVYTTLSLPPGPATLPLDMVLLNAAQQTSKTVFGLETLAEQTAVFESLKVDHQIALVTESVCHYAQLHAMTEELIAAYRRGDLGAVYQQAQASGSPAQTALNEVLLVARNRRMARRLVPYLDTGGAFIAIGALHLPGDDGVLARLVRKGYRVRPLADR